MTVLGLGVAVEIFTEEGTNGISVIDNVMGVINGLGSAGFAGLVGLCVL